MDENGNTVCTDPQYADGDVQSEQEKPEADKVEPIEPIPPPPTPTAATVEEKSDPPWYECVLSIDCLKKKAENTVDSLLEKGKQLLIDDFHERFQKASQQCKEFSLICLSKEMAIGATADTLHISNPFMGLFSGIVDHFTGINPIEEMVHFVVDHPVFSMVTVASIVLASFFPAIGVPMLLGGLVSGGTSYLMGNDWETVLRDTWIGELAGIIGYGGYFSVARPLGRKLLHTTLSPFLKKWLPRIAGGGSEAYTGSLSFDWLRDGKVNWKNSLVALGIGITIPFVGSLADSAGPQARQLVQNIGIGDDGTLGMPWFNKADDSVSKAAGKGGGIASKSTGVSRYKNVEPPVYYQSEKDGKRYAISTVNKKPIKLRRGDLAGKTHPKTNVPYDQHGFPVFDSKFDTYLPEDILMSSRNVHFNRCNKALFEEIEKNPKLAKKFTPEEIEMFKSGETPERFTWHHHQDVGRMQLVDYTIHRKTGHTGGYKIWGKDQFKD